MEFVLASLLRLVALEEHYSAALVARGEVVAGLIELDGGYYVGFCNVFYISLIAKASAMSPLAYRHLIPERSYEAVSRCGKCGLRKAPT